MIPLLFLISLKIDFRGNFQKGLYKSVWYAIIEWLYAGMMELVDMRDLGSRGASRWGSSPHTRTTSERNPLHSVLRRSLFGAALKLRSAPLLLLSNLNPLRWASSWFLVHDDRLYLFYQHMISRVVSPDHYITLTAVHLWQSDTGWKSGD